MNYYNEFDPYAAQWLRHLIAAGLIPKGEVDDRSITEVTAGDLSDFTQCHFFAGIGGWSLALRMASWPESRPVWTGSCPCQPFSAAGKQRGEADERHLWPEFARLIGQCKPPVVFGEQVASKIGRDWLAGVFADLEAVGYAAAGADICAAGVGAPHIRQRLFWVADANQDRGLGHPFEQGLEGHSGYEPNGDQSGRDNADQGGPTSETGGAGERMSDADGWNAGPEREQRSGEQRLHAESGRNHWSSAEWVECADGKARRIEPAIEPLVNGLPTAMDGCGPISRTGTLKGAGNAIVPQVAAAFITAYTESG